MQKNALYFEGYICGKSIKYMTDVLQIFRRISFVGGEGALVREGYTGDCLQWQYFIS